MRLTHDQIHTTRHLVRQTAGETARVRLFGSRLDDGAKGGDVDLMLVLPEPVDNTALPAAQLSARISRAMSGRNWTH
ncbi:nucleotidyltransferase domain-containing protein [Methylococcus mesophilus]|uniref:nucleotidyltransferase domain-containing protein n=1 Tax=Methylococcus mesophilus TaxID=2993564 RepID=UPI00224B1AA8|nr:nucleotidyltransferase domain-containing protein [Methylococcus mesophilus]UZR28709.1 nucleotidyltransferase domain-containing protein [Methylococcus mesophilus]